MLYPMLDLLEMLLKQRERVRAREREMRTPLTVVPTGAVPGRGNIAPRIRAPLIEPAGHAGGRAGRIVTVRGVERVGTSGA